MFDVGAKPPSRPIRKRAWFRALRRGAMWLIMSYKDYSTLPNIGISNTFNGTKYNKIIPDKNIKSGTAYIIWPLT